MGFQITQNPDWALETGSFAEAYSAGGFMNDQPYTAHDATAENKGRPVWNVKGPAFDRLIAPVGHEEPIKVAVRAVRYAADLNEAFRQGHQSATKGTP